VLLEQGNIDDAIAAFQKALTINPNYAEVHYNMGNALLQGRRLDDAFKSYNKAISVRPNYAEAYSNLGNVLKEMRKPDAAIASYQKALEIMPDFAEACGNLGNTLLSANRPSEAIVYLTKAHALEPNEKHAYLLNSLQGVTSENAPREYVEDLFDSYAERFEEHLVGKLEYGIPKLLKETLADLNLLSTVVSTTVDMGCGTGLLGTEFRPKTKNLIGIDLSEKMIAQARSKQLYDTLIVDDLVSGLAGIGAKIDLFLAADVFVYVGKLHATFEAVKAVAARGAHFAFSLEEHDGAEPFYLQKSARYAHSKTYIEALAEEFGFSVLHFQRTQIRKDKQNWINGFIYVLQNSDSGL
jgi:predicted TPR repeat methyltransferase